MNERIEMEEHKIQCNGLEIDHEFQLVPLARWFSQWKIWKNKMAKRGSQRKRARPLESRSLLLFG